MAGTVDLVTGSLYAWPSHAGERPLAEGLAGLACGLVAGGLLALILAQIRSETGHGGNGGPDSGRGGGLFQITEN